MKKSLLQEIKEHEHGMIYLLLFFISILLTVNFAYDTIQDKSINVIVDIINERGLQYRSPLDYSNLTMDYYPEMP